MEIRKRTTRRRRKSTARKPAGTLSARKRTTRRRTHRRKGLLHEMVSAPAATSAAKAIASGLVGAFIGTQIVKLFPDQKPLAKVLIVAGLAFVTGTMLKMPNVAAGLAGAGLIPILTTKPTLSENFLSQDDLEQLPAVLSESYLSESYLSENYLSSGAYDYMEAARQ